MTSPLASRVLLSRRWWLPGIGCWLSAVAAVAAPACRAPVEFPPQAREELVAATLRSNVFAAARDDYADLRLLDDAGRPVPFVLETLVTRKQTAVRHDCAVSGPQARELDNQALELTFTLLPDVPSPSGLTIDTPLRDFRQRVRVESSADGAAWQVLVDGAMLYDLSRFVNVRQCDVSWSVGAGRRFRVTFFDATRDRPDDVREVTSGTSGTNVRQYVRTEPFHVRSARFWRVDTVDAGSTPVQVVYPLSRDEAATQKKDGRFVFRSSREPLTRMVLSTTSRLFHRSYRLYGRNGSEDAAGDAPGRLLAAGMLTQIRFQEIARTDMTIDFPVSRFREYVLVCEPSAGEEADITATRAEGERPRVIFAATPDRNYTLLFGDPTAEYPVMPEAAALRTLLGSNRRLIEATVGDSTGTPGALRTWRAWLNSSAVMIGAMIVAGLLLALVLAHASRKADRL